MQITITDKNFISELEGLQYEVDSRRSIITYMLGNNMPIDNESFRLYQKEFMEFLIKYEAKKRDVETLYVYPQVAEPKSWNLDFKTGVLDIKC